MSRFIYFWNVPILILGVSRNMTTWNSSLILEFICDNQSSTYLNNHVWFLKQQPKSSSSPGISKMRSDFFVLPILPEILRIQDKFQFSLINTKISIFFKKKIPKVQFSLINTKISIFFSKYQNFNFL